MNKSNSHILPGLAIGLIVGGISVLSLVFSFANKSNLIVIILLVLLFLGLLLSTKKYIKTTNNIDFKNLFINGFKTTAVITLTVLLIGYITLSFLPSIKNNVINDWEEKANEALIVDSSKKMNNLRGISDTLSFIKTKDSINNEISENRKLTNTNKAYYIKNFTTIFVGQNLLSCMAIGVFASAICAFIFRKKV